jgi:hypothetical protein
MESPPAGPKIWYDNFRKTEAQGGSKYHKGNLELVTWEFKDEDGEQLGWGAVLIEESADMKKKFEEEFQGDQEKLYKYWPNAFRWTCCGTSGDNDYACDHHDKGCTCDFCLAGMPLSKEALKTTVHNFGLKLRTKGHPDSVNPIGGQLNWQMRMMMNGLLGFDKSK